MIKGALVFLAVASLVWAQEPQSSEEVALTPGELLDRGDHEGAIELLASYAAEFESQRAHAPEDQSIAGKLARVLIWQGSLELDLTQSKAAVKSFLHAQTLLRKQAPPEARLLGTCLDGLGRAYHHGGNYQAAAAALEQALEYRQTLPDELQKKWVPATREHLGLLLLAMGHYEEAGGKLKKALSETDPEDLASLAQRHTSLGRYYHALRSYARAREHLEQALTLAEQTWGRDDPNTFTLLDQLGLTLLRQGETALARAALEEATTLAQPQAQTTIGGIRFATILNNYGNLLIDEGELVSAQEAFSAALQELSKTLGENHPALAPLWNNLGFTSLQQNDHEQAITYFEKTRHSYLSHVGPLHQRSVEALTNLALASYLSKQPNAEAEIRKAAIAHQRMIPQLLSFGTETQRLNYLQRVDALSLPCSSGRDAGLIADTLIRTKGRLLDALLSEKSSHPTPEESPPGWREVQSALLPGSALIDLVRYHNYDPANPQGLAYGAVVLLPAGEPQWIRLGSEESLLNWLGAVQDRLAWRSTQSQRPSPPPPLKLRPALRRLHDEFWAPIAAVLPAHTHTLALCPDSTLNFLSFATLLNAQDQFLCQQYPVAFYLSSARDLLAPRSATSLTKNPWTIFSVEKFAQAAQTADPSNLHEEQLLQTLSHLHPIAGARREVKVLKRYQAPGSQVFEDEQAHELQLRQMKHSPAVLHLITHGFFLPGDSSPQPRLTDFDEAPERLNRSGLVLQAAGIGGPKDRDDILFASDVASLPLENTRLVTLSSCDSGLGEGLAGEGILGLRRGFALAGAHNLLLTLWPVSDASTPAFMDRFYQIALHTDHLGQAVWQTQKEFLAPVNPAKEKELELAVLRYGPFVLCQREALRPAAATIPPPRHHLPTQTWLALLALAALVFFAGVGLQTRRKQ